MIFYLGTHCPEWLRDPAFAGIPLFVSRRRLRMLEWAAPMDWMCEPFVLAKTGKTLKEHQRLTVENYLDLRSIAPDLPFAPVLQGWKLDDYIEHVDQYDAAGVDLRDEAIVGVGSVCRRQSTREGARIFRVLSALGLAVHGFGVKTQGIEVYAHALASADSAAWSYAAFKRRDMLPGCDHVYGSCANCPIYARKWRENILEKMRKNNDADLS